MTSLVKMSSEIEDYGGRGGDGVNLTLMVEEGGAGGGEGGGGEIDLSRPYYLDKFTLFETASHFYLIGRDKERLRWRVLKIGRSEPSKVVTFEDPTIYSYPQCKLLLKDINEVNRPSGGRKFVTDCYGIVGFVKFLGPYYILLITKRKEIGKICGHSIYSISEYKMIPLPHSNVSYMDNSERENRYKKLLWLVDIRKDFFFSYSYPIMHRLQKNLSQKEVRPSSVGKMFVWNEYLTQRIRNHLKNTLWTVALVHGFFKQVELSAGGKNFLLTLIARRSCQFAGTRYHKRGVNELGQAANDVEIEQIVWQESHNGKPYKISSVVQNRGSIPLLWSQKHSMWNLKPDILFSEGNLGYEATQLHFSNLRLRYGDPIILFNLVKSSGKNKREAFICNEFHKAVYCINKTFEEEYPLELRNLDLDAAFKTKDADVMSILKGEAESALSQTEFYSSQVPDVVDFEASSDLSSLWVNTNCAQTHESSDYNNINTTQKGILRTNCLDSLDRTNAAQYVYSLVALGHQLKALGLTGSPEQDFNSKLAHDLMSLFEALGDSLAQQYGGSAAHSKIFSKTRGQCKAATIFQDLFKSIQRHFNNSFLDSDKQQAFDLFLGQFKPEIDQLARLNKNVGWKFNGQRRKSIYEKPLSRSRLKKSQSDSEVLYNFSSVSGEKTEISSSSDLSDSRGTSYVSSGRLLTEFERHWYGGLNNYADKVDSLSWAGSVEHSEEEQSDDEWMFVGSPVSSAYG